MRRLLQIGLILIFCSYGFAQDAEFSQFYANPVYLNPALAGSAERCRLNLNTRVKYPTFNAFKTFSVAYDQALFRGWNDTPFGGAGVHVMVHSADGILNNYTLNANYAHYIKVARELYVNLGITGGVLVKTLNPTNIILPDGTLGGGEEGINRESLTIPDFGFGVYATYKSIYYAGFSMMHLQGFVPKSKSPIPVHGGLSNYVPYKITIHGGAEFRFRYETSLSPNIVLLHQKGFNQVNLGLYANLARITIGAWYKTNLRKPLPDAISANTHVVTGLIGLNFENINIGYTYDACISGLGAEAHGAHEVTMSWTFDMYTTRKKRAIGAIKTPSF